MNSSPVSGSVLKKCKGEKKEERVVLQKKKKKTSVIGKNKNTFNRLKSPIINK